MARYIKIAMRATVETHDWSVGERFLRTFPKKLSPDRVYSDFDTAPSDFPGVEGCEQKWSKKIVIKSGGSAHDSFSGFSWHRKKNLKSSGYIYHTGRNIYNNIVPGNISAESAWEPELPWQDLFLSWVRIFEPQVGFLHLFTGMETSSQLSRSKFNIGSFGAALAPVVPNAGWAMFFGERFAQHVDAGRLNALGFEVKEYPFGLYTQITPNIEDVISNYDAFSASRIEFKSAFPADFFDDEKYPE